jgi:hypothetical protein
MTMASRPPAGASSSPVIDLDTLSIAEETTDIF